MPVDRSIAVALTGAVLLACVSTLGDMVWYELQLPHRMMYGVVHGVGLCLAVGLYIGASLRRPWTGAAAGAAIGLASSGGYYVLAPLIGPAVMFAIWMALWMAMAALPAVLGGPRSSRTILTRGLVAAAGSGAAFYAVSGIWMSTPEGRRNYFFHFICWTTAYFPAFLAILYRRPGEGAEGRGGVSSG
jgi:hypothetical protein